MCAGPFFLSLLVPFFFLRALRSSGRRVLACRLRAPWPPSGGTCRSLQLAGWAAHGAVEAWASPLRLRPWPPLPASPLLAPPASGAVPVVCQSVAQRWRDGGMEGWRGGVSTLWNGGGRRIARRGMYAVWESLDECVDCSAHAKRPSWREGMTDKPPPGGTLVPEGRGARPPPMTLL